jgi:hypothetical protein
LAIVAPKVLLKEGESVIEAPDTKITDGLRINRENKASSKR